MDLTNEELTNALKRLVETRNEQSLRELTALAQGRDGPNAGKLREALEARREIFRRGAAA